MNGTRDDDVSSKVLILTHQMEQVQTSQAAMAVEIQKSRETTIDRYLELMEAIRISSSQRDHRY